MTVAALVAPSVVAASANADPVSISYSSETTQIDVTQPADCFEGDAHIVGPEVVTTKAVMHPDGQLNLIGDLVDTFSVEFDNGWTGAWTTKEHFAFSVGGKQAVLTNVHRDSTQVYDQTGSPVGVAAVRVVAHTTFANGEVRTDFEHFRLTCDF